MTRKEAERQTRQQDQLRALGFTRDEAEALRRISMTLQRWFEQECGDSNQYASWAIERDDTTERPYMVRHIYAHGQGQDRTIRTPIADREAGARRRLERILADRNARVEAGALPAASPEVIASIGRDALTAYVQSDPRGAALYIIRPGDVPTDCDVMAYYTRGLCVY